MSPAPEHLLRAARARTRQAEQRARAALKAMTRAREAISFTAVARKARVSTDFLYGHSELRAQVERHRTKHGPARHTGPELDTTSTSAAVRALSTRLAQQRQAHRDEIISLRKALEVAQGENLVLRRRLARHEPD